MNDDDVCLVVDDRKERKKEEDVLNTVINTESSTTRLIVSFSITPRFFDLWKRFLKIAKREAGFRGRSEVFARMLSEFVRRHEEGNPDMKLTTYMDPFAPSPMRVLCWSLAGATSEGKVYCRKAGESVRTGGGAWVQGIRCYSCPNNELRKKKEP